MTEIAENNEEAPFDKHVQTAIQILFAAFFIIVPTIYIGSALESFDTVKIFILKTAALGALFLWIRKLFFEGRFTIPRTKADVFIILLIIWTLICSISSVNKYRAFNHWVVILSCIGLFYATMAFFRRKEDVEKMLLFSLVPVFFVAAVGILDIMGKSFFVWDYLFINPLYSVYSYFDFPAGIPGKWSTFFQGRMSSTFGNPTDLAGFSLMLIPVTLGLLFSAKSKTRMAFCLLILAQLFFLLIASFTRSAWAVLIITLVIFAYLAARKRLGSGMLIRGVAVAALFIAILGAFAFLQHPKQKEHAIAERIKSYADLKDRSMLERMLIWKTGLEMIKDNPVKGVGLNNYLVKHPYYQKKFLKDKFWSDFISFPSRAHNEFIDICAETGIIGFVIFCLIAAIIGLSGKKALDRGKDESLLAAGIISGVAGIFMYSVFQFPLHVIPTVSFMWVYAGLLLVLGGEGASWIAKPEFVRRTASRLKLITAACVLIFLFFSASYTRPLIGQIAFAGALKNCTIANADKCLDLLEYGLSTNADDLYILTRYGEQANLISMSYADEARRKGVSKRVAEASVIGSRLYPYDDRMFTNFGVAQFMLEDYDAAMESFSVALAINPFNGLANVYLGDMYFSMRRYDEAIDCYRAAAVHDPWTGGVFENLEAKMTRIGRLDEALKIVDEAIAYKHFYQVGKLVRFNMYYARWSIKDKLGREKDTAVDFDKAFQFVVEMVDAGDYLTAHEKLTMILTRLPDCGPARYQLGRLYFLMNRKDAAARELKKAAELMEDPRDAVRMLDAIGHGIGK